MGAVLGASVNGIAMFFEVLISCLREDRAGFENDEILRRLSSWRRMKMTEAWWRRCGSP